MPDDISYDAYELYRDGKKKRKMLAPAVGAPTADPTIEGRLAPGGMGGRAMLDRGMDQGYAANEPQAAAQAPAPAAPRAPSRDELVRLASIKNRMLMQARKSGDPYAAKQAETDLFNVNEAIKHVGQSDALYQSPDKIEANRAELKRQFAQNTGGTGGRISPGMTPDPKANATAFFLDNGQDRYAGATDTFTRLNRANTNRQDLNAEQNAPRELTFDTLDTPERRARLEARTRYIASPELARDLDGLRMQDELAVKARNAGNEMATLGLDTGVESGRGALEESRLKTKVAQRGLQSVSDDEMYTASRGANLAGEAEKQSKSRYNTAKYDTERSRVESGVPSIAERLDRTVAEKQLRDVVRADVLDKEGITDIGSFLSSAEEAANRLGGSVGLAGLGATDAGAERGFRQFEDAFLSKMERLAKVPELAPIIADWAMRVAPAIEANLPEATDPSVLGTVGNVVATGFAPTNMIQSIRTLYNLAQDTTSAFQSERINRLRAMSNRARSIGGQR